MENGVDLDGHPEGVRKRGFALALGRICREKGFHLALDAAKTAGAPLLLAGAVFPFAAHETYFARRIAPKLDARRRWLGEVTGAPKLRLLAAARCLLVPSLAPETSSLVAREALAAGTPVVAFADAGALAEVVEPGRTGFLVRNVKEMAAAIDACVGLDPQVCRQAARERFSAARMTDAYLDLYARAAAGEL